MQPGTVAARKAAGQMHTSIMRTRRSPSSILRRLQLEAGGSLELTPGRRLAVDEGLPPSTMGIEESGFLLTIGCWTTRRDSHALSALRQGEPSRPPPVERVASFPIQVSAGSWLALSGLDGSWVAGWPEPQRFRPVKSRRWPLRRG
ncbi:MAG: hypothetical protein DLM66_08300 [Candidatus Dormiibacter spiritus]|nr:MAG: hypothetical protein DLM66_08300 [Candidatus Dormibacteraeota bacterium]